MLFTRKFFFLDLYRDPNFWSKVLETYSKERVILPKDFPRKLTFVQKQFFLGKTFWIIFRGVNIFHFQNRRLITSWCADEEGLLFAKLSVGREEKQFEQGVLYSSSTCTKSLFGEYDCCGYIGRFCFVDDIDLQVTTFDIVSFVGGSFFAMYYEKAKTSSKVWNLLPRNKKVERTWEPFFCTLLLIWKGEKNTRIMSCWSFNFNFWKILETQHLFEANFLKYLWNWGKKFGVLKLPRHKLMKWTTIIFQRSLAWF